MQTTVDASQITSQVMTSANESKTPGTFSKCLAVERNGQVIADQLYRQLFPDRTIFRPDYHKKGYEHDLQAHDVDVVLRWTLDSGWPTEQFISEKFRSKVYYDEMIEIYEDYDNKKPGWALQTSAEEYYMFHNPREKGEFDPYVIIIPAWAVKKLAQMARDQFEYVMEAMGDKMFIKLDFLGEHTCMIAMHTFGGKDKILWTNRCIAIPYECFKYINAPIKRYEYIDGTWVHDDKFYKLYNTCN